MGLLRDCFYFLLALFLGILTACLVFFSFDFGVDLLSNAIKNVVEQLYNSHNSCFVELNVLRLSFGLSLLGDAYNLVHIDGYGFGTGFGQSELERILIRRF